LLLQVLLICGYHETLHPYMSEINTTPRRIRGLLHLTQVSVVAGLSVYVDMSESIRKAIDYTLKSSLRT
jgi:hypothetical protein